MDYDDVLRFAGAEVIAFEQFGDYQGTFWALVKYDGKTGWIRDYFGSCSGCDTLCAMGYDLQHQHGDGYENQVDLHDFLDKEDSSCPECVKIRQELADLGRGMLENMMTQDEAETKAGENLEWDFDASNVLAFIKKTGDGGRAHGSKTRSI